MCAPENVPRWGVFGADTWVRPYGFRADSVRVERVFFAARDAVFWLKEPIGHEL